MNNSNMAIPLREDKKGLVPKHRQLARIVGEPVEVRNNSINHAERQCILLVEKHAHKNTIGT
jgi:hypothetical protein